MSGTILLVDDEQDNLEPMRLMLDQDYRVLTAECAEQALEILEQGGIEVIISDQRMPGMSGVELLTRVRALYPEVVRLILTGYSDLDAMMKAINEGRVYRYILKPWDIDDMRLTIAQALDWKHLRSKNGQLATDLQEANRILSERNRELEQAQQTIVKQEKLAAIGSFAAEMVHEINSHLQIIFGLKAEMAHSSSMDNELLEELQLQTVTLAELVADIRDFTRETVAPFSLERIDPRTPAHQVMRICRYHPDFRGLRVRLDAEDCPAAWHLDPRQIKHLLLNLLKNAAKASPRELDLVIWVGTEDEALSYRVIDRGPGIPGEQHERIFDPFFSTREHEGSGLGLSICRRVADMHGGAISCENTPGGGATFVVRLPKYEPARKPSASEPRQSAHGM